MKEINVQTLIIGAGPAGLACAMELSKAKADFMVVEKSSAVGGLSKTYSFKEKDGTIFYTDNGPHRFFSKNPYLYSFIGETLQDDWIKVKRHTRQYIDGKFYDYPINAIQAFRNIGFLRALQMSFDYTIARLLYGVLRKKINNFKDYVTAHFGKSLGEFNMINYSEKIWGIPSQKIHADWAQQRITGLSIFTILLSFLKIPLGKSKPKSLIDTFYYPRKGTGQIYESIKDTLEKTGYKIVLNTWPTSIDRKDTHFETIILDTAGQSCRVISRYIVESVPIKEFIDLLGTQVSGQIKKDTLNLKYRSQVYLFITLNKEYVTQDQWIYFPEKNIPFARISEMKNFSSYMSPPHTTSLFVEFFCFEGDEIWNMSKDELFNLTLTFFEKNKWFTRSEVRAFYKISQKNVYPIYDLKYKEYLGTIKGFLDTIPNLFYIGRPGRFRYNNQDHSLEMGIMAARSVIDGKTYDIESIGQDRGYFEKGSIPQFPKK